MNLAIIQARLGSTRLPNKVLLTLAGKTVLEHVVNRARASKFIDEVIIATTISKNDLEIVSFCSKNKIRVFVGSEDDVLDRYYQTARLLQPDNVVRITSDCPMIDPEIIDQIGKKHLEEHADYSSNTLHETYPDGLDAEVISFQALKTAWEQAILPSDREHVTPFIKKQPESFKLLSIKNDNDLSYMRWTIDQPEDFTFLNEIFNRLYFINNDFRTKDVLKEIAKDPDLLKINKGIIRNEGYLKSLLSD